ncbi:MAG: peptidoglycan DD-metalloendopeptidase family protein [Bacteroidetes Order II. Incertae sedis bacterium]|nr:peptidoglycan DD-metalloendopeptidase family protein [Bacteroidetes Order II. bacterium]
MRDRSLLAAAIMIAVVAFLVVRVMRAPIAHPAGEGVVQTASLSLDEFGLDTQALEIRDEMVSRNQTFSDLLTPHKVDYQRIVELASSGKDVFDVRRLKAQRPYHVYLDSMGVAKYMVYEQNRTSYVVFDLGDNPSIRLEEREVAKVVRSVSGIISSSLFMTLDDLGEHPALSISMSDVFAWQIDFSRLQKGDSFRIVFEEHYVGDERVQVGDILAARFIHRDEDYFAFNFVEGDINEHYDEVGNSLRKAFLIAPVEYKRISSGFSGRRFHPVQKRYKAHLGTDYAADRGTPIQATGDGVVTHATYGKYNGNYVKIKHNGTYTTQYLHMSKIKTGIRPGVRVKQGQTIGFVGSTGLATGNHVCYRFWKNGQQVDHRREKIPSIGPVPTQFRTQFELLRDSYLVELSLPIQSEPTPAYPVLKDHAAIAAP